MNTLQALGAQQIKQLADQLGGEGSAAHTALHAVLACAGAAATSGNCTTAALASSSGVVINTLLDSLEGTNSHNLTAAEKDARANLITTLVTGVTSSLGGDAAVANTAARIETENNALLPKVIGISPVVTRFFATCLQDAKLCSYTQIQNLQNHDLEQDKHIFELVGEYLIQDSKEAIDGIENLPEVLSYLYKHPEQLEQLPDAVKDAFIAAINEYKTHAYNELIGNFTDTPEWYEKQAQAEARIITTLGETLASAGAGKVALSSGKVVVNSVLGIKFGAKGLGGVVNLADIGMQWGKGISNQGKPFELFVQGLLPEGTIDLNLIKTSFKTFDHFTPDGTAVSTKTMDTVGSVTYQNPSKITYQLNKYVDEMVNFTKDGKGTFNLDNSMINNKVMQLAIPYATTPEQMVAIAKSIQYAASLPTPIKIIVTKVK